MARVVRPWATWVSGRRKLMVNSGKDETLGSTCYALRILPYMGKHWQGWRVLRRGLWAHVSSAAQFPKAPITRTCSCSGSCHLPNPYPTLPFHSWPHLEHLIFLLLEHSGPPPCSLCPSANSKAPFRLDILKVPLPKSPRPVCTAYNLTWQLSVSLPGFVHPHVYQVLFLFHFGA